MSNLQSQFLICCGILLVHIRSNAECRLIQKGRTSMRRLLSLLLFVVLTSAGISGQAQQIDPKKSEFFPIDQVKPGMRATGYTVFVGSEPKPFELEILGVLKGFPNPRQSAVLAKLIGEEVSHTGVFQGMS